MNVMGNQTVPHTDEPRNDAPGEFVGVYAGKDGGMFTLISNTNAKLPVLVVWLQPGDVLVFSGELRTRWEHAVWREVLPQALPIRGRESTLDAYRIVLNLRFFPCTQRTERAWFDLNRESYKLDMPEVLLY